MVIFRDDGLFNRIHEQSAFVFVDDAHRGRRISGRMIEKVLEYAKCIGYDKVYIMSGEKGLYEKYGFAYMGDFESIYGGKDRLLAISL